MRGKEPIILQCSKGLGAGFPKTSILRSNIMINLHFHQPATVSEKASQVLSAVLLVLSGALALVTFAAS
jgi:hypothetical protein